MELKKEGLIFRLNEIKIEDDIIKKYIITGEKRIGSISINNKSGNIVLTLIIDNSPEMLFYSKDSLPIPYEKKNNEGKFLQIVEDEETYEFLIERESKTGLKYFDVNPKPVISLECPNRAFETFTNEINGLSFDSIKSAWNIIINSPDIIQKAKEVLAK